ncbi:MAG: DUF6378 domain-containing protein [Planctomycetota bacterium]
MKHKVEKIVQGRRRQYGHPAHEFARAAGMWSIIIGSQVTPAQVGLCMAALKICRECHRHKLDNIQDAIGYLICVQDTYATRRQTR